VLAQNVAMPGTRVPVFRYCFPPPTMAGYEVQHLAECNSCKTLRHRACLRKIRRPLVKDITHFLREKIRKARII